MAGFGEVVGCAWVAAFAVGFGVAWCPPGFPDCSLAGSFAHPVADTAAAVLVNVFWGAFVAPFAVR